MTRTAVEQYSKAIKLFVEGPACGVQWRQTSLTVCLSFICIELLLDDPKAAMSHLQSGLKIVKFLEAKAALSDVEMGLLRAFTHLQANAKIHGCVGSTINEENQETNQAPMDLPFSFSSLQIARMHLDDLCARTAFCRRRMKQLTGSNKDIWSQQSLRQSLLSQETALARWYTLFQSLPEHRQGGSTPNSIAAICLLELRYCIQKIIQRNLLDSSEISYDNYRDHFERVLLLAENFLDTVESLGHFPFSLESGLIPALFCTALKCRDPALRAQALALLTRCPYREGIWHRDSIIQVAHWKIINETARALPNGIILESARVHREELTEVDVNNEKTIVVKYKRGPDTNEKSRMLDLQNGHLIAVMGDMI